VTDRINFRALLTLGFGILGLMILSTVATAQTPAATIRIDYVLPTKHTDGTDIPATGAGSIGSVEGYISATTIPNAPSGAPTFTQTPAGTTTSQPLTLPAGSTARVRLRVRTVGGIASDLANEVTVIVPGKPGVPTSVTLQITLT
jgi:hypothetical protein